MKLSEALAKLEVIPKMEEVLDALIPQTVLKYKRGTDQISLCACCPVAIYLEEQVDHMVYVDYNTCYLLGTLAGRVPLPERVARYVRVSTLSLLDLTRP